MKCRVGTKLINLETKTFVLTRPQGSSKIRFIIESSWNINETPWSVFCLRCSR